MNRTVLYVSGFSHNLRARDLAYEFERYGRLVRCDIPASKSPQSTPFAFVEFRREDDAEDAYYDMHGRSIDGRRIAVQWAKRPPSAAWRHDGGSERPRDPPRDSRDRDRDYDRDRRRSPPPRRRSPSPPRRTNRDDRDDRDRADRVDRPDREDRVNDRRRSLSPVGAGASGDKRSGGDRDDRDDRQERDAIDRELEEDDNRGNKSSEGGKGVNGEEQDRERRND